MNRDSAEQTLERKQSINTPKPGGVSIEDFNIKALLGRGSYGEVFLVQKKGTDQEFALKTMEKVHMAKEKKTHHVFIEREVLTSCASEWLVQLHACFQDKEKFYFLMQKVTNGELQKYITDKGSLPLNEVQFLAAEIVCILEMMRDSGIVHRDLKPDNLLFDNENHLKIIDFGTAMFLENEKNQKFYDSVLKIKEKYQQSYDHVSLEQMDDNEDEDEDCRKKKDSFVGTPLYLSPELIEEADFSYPADLWALGIIIYQMLVGHCPYEDLSVFELYEKIKNCDFPFPEGLDEDVADLLRQIFKKDPKERIGFNSPSLANPYDAVKAHKFFTGIDWENIRKIKSPVQNKAPELKPWAMMESIVQVGQEARKPKVIMSGLIKKYKLLMIYDTRQLILYDNQTLAYFNSSSGEKRGEIKLTSNCKAFGLPGKPNAFKIQVPKRIYDLESSEYPAKEWIAAINKEIANI